MATRITGKQRAARKRNIKIARQAKKKLPKSRRYKVVGGQTSLGGKLPKLKRKLSRPEKSKVKHHYKSALEMGMKRKTAVKVGLLSVSKKSSDISYARARRIRVRIR